VNLLQLISVSELFSAVAGNRGAAREQVQPCWKQACLSLWLEQKKACSWVWHRLVGDTWILTTPYSYCSSPHAGHGGLAVDVYTDVSPDGR